MASVPEYLIVAHRETQSRNRRNRPVQRRVHGLRALLRAQEQGVLLGEFGGEGGDALDEFDILLSGRAHILACAENAVTVTQIFRYQFNFHLRFPFRRVRPSLCRSSRTTSPRGPRNS